MFKKILVVISLAATFSSPVKAADFAAPIRQIITCSDTWFEIELVGKTMPYNGGNSLIRFMVKSGYVGAEKYKQLYAMSLTAFATQTSVWIGTYEATTTTSVAGGNCNTNNTPAQNAFSMSIYR